MREDTNENRPASAPKLSRLATVERVGDGRVTIEGIGSFPAKRAQEQAYGRFLYLRDAVRVTLEPAGVDPVLLALVNAPVIEGEPDPNEPPIDDLHPDDCVPHEIVLQQPLDRAKVEHEALTAEVARLRRRDEAWQAATRCSDPDCFWSTI